MHHAIVVSGLRSTWYIVYMYMYMYVRAHRKRMPGVVCVYDKHTHVHT